MNVQGKAAKTCTKCGEVKAPAEFYRKKPGLLYSHCKQCIREKTRAWEKANSERVEAQRQRHRKRHPDKARARWILNSRVAEGRIKKPDRCEECDELVEVQKLHGHHHDYSKPTEVRWLCPACHAVEHYEPRAEAGV